MDHRGKILPPWNIDHVEKDSEKSPRYMYYTRLLTILLSFLLRSREKLI